MHCNVVIIHKQFYIYTETSDLWDSLLQFQSAASISDLFSCSRTTESHASVVHVVLYNVHSLARLECCTQMHSEPIYDKN